VQSAIRLAASDCYADRLTAGYLLAEEAGDEQVDAILRLLLLDEHDTAVTQVTAEALLRRHDRIGMALVLEAWRDCDDHTGEHLADAVLNAYNGIEADRSAFGNELEAVLSTDPRLAAVVDEVSQWLGIS
jgi:hypothetical protein